MLTEKERERERRHKKRERERSTRQGLGGCPEPPSEIPPMTRSYGRAMTSKVP